MREHEDIQEVKAMKFPPPRLALAFEVVGALLQKPHSGWEDAKKMIEDEKVKDVHGVFICFRRFSSDFHISNFERRLENLAGLHGSVGQLVDHGCAGGGGHGYNACLASIQRSWWKLAGTSIILN